MTMFGLKVKPQSLVISQTKINGLGYNKNEELLIEFLFCLFFTFIYVYSMSKQETT